MRESESSYWKWLYTKGCSYCLPSASYFVNKCIAQTAILNMLFLSALGMTLYFNGNFTGIVKDDETSYNSDDICSFWSLLELFLLSSSE